MNKSYSFILVVLLMLLSATVSAQRKQQPLGRGVVAVQNGSNVAVTWRRLAQEAETAKWNIYVRKSGATEFAKINNTPLTNTNYRTTTSTIPTGSQVAVTRVVGDVESELSVPFDFKSQSIRNVYMEISFDSSPLDKSHYTTKFVWPCDLNGNGEYDYVVDRIPTDGTRNRYIEGYLADGTFLWNVDLGVNEVPCDGQNDNLCAYDIDCDGYGELIVQTSDGTRLWDKENGTWGKYVLGKDTADSDGDGIIDYDTQSTKNPPRYMTVIDGMTGAEKASAEFAYDVAYNRTNKASLMGDEYNKHEGHVGIFYFDGVHPGIVGEWHTRSADGGTHYYRNVAFAYVGGEWKLLFSKETGGVVFHQIRIADVDGDGCDEMLSGEYAMDQDGSTLYRAHIAHGDRHRISDIDPERPGLECYAIQQNAGDMLGQILYDAGTGEAIKKWYLPAVGDVGRGECMDIDKSHLGWEMWSTMDGVYDAKGNRIDNLTNTYPTEGIWWDGQLDREILQTSDSHYNFYIQDYFNGRLIEPAKESGWQLRTSYGKRAKFWGDIIGDWREEIIVIREVNGVCQGIVGLTTDIATSVKNIYCLQQDPHYRGDCTTRGYYQSPNPGFYLGYDMPRPQLPPCMVADELNEVFDLTLGNASVSPKAGMENVYLMPVKNQTLTLASTIGGTTNVWKSQQGSTMVTADITSTGQVIISEGTLQVDGTISTPIDLRARGTLSGSGTVNAVSFEGALNYEGGRIMPLGTLTFNAGLNIDHKTFVEINIDDASKIKVNGDLAVSASTVFTINSASPAEGDYKLIEYTGQFTGDVSSFSVRGLKGLSYNIVQDEQAIVLRINSQRNASNGVKWTGAESSEWDYQTENWLLNDEATAFVAGDGVVFDDNASSKSVSIPQLMPVGKVEVNNSATYTFSGDGGLSGEGMLVKNGSGRLVLNSVNSDYTGATVINEGTVTVKELADGGIPSSIGAASTSADNFKIGKATLIIDNKNTATNRGVILADTATISIASGTVAFKGQVKGDGVMKKIGNGQVNITYAGTNLWGGTILQAGTLAMGAWNTTFGRATSPIHVTGNSTISVFDQNSSSTIPSFQNATTIDAGKTLTFNAGSRSKIQGSLMGKGTFKINFPYVRADVTTDCSNFEGTYWILVGSKGNARFRKAMDLSKATLRLDENVYLAGYSSERNEGNFTHKIGELTSTATNCTLSTGTWNVGYLGTTSTYAGTFNANATINKYGTGRLILTGASAGAVNVNEGELQANNTSASVTSGTITVNNGGLLSGNGQVQNVSVKNGGVIGAGRNAATVGTLTVNGSLTVASGGIIRVRIRNTTTGVNSDAFKVAGVVRLTSPVINVEALNDREIVDDAEVKVFTGDGNVTITGDVTIMPATPKQGWLWDTSALATDGILRVVPDPVAIASISSDALADAEIYDLAGRPVQTIRSSGVYVVNGKKMYVVK